ncbi:protein DpdJ [Micromonospora sp. NBC_01699]|uniref:protein DpdJ n=1 Tax=Micromonospora sp. NBC_01699 TaxID=2975984 RepID=UPI002E29F07B|nr:protein DpdJ [Micromonospora sp. NBC_01699]
MVDIDHQVLLRVLDELEDHEARNLVWGLTEESWTQEALIDRISRAATLFDPHEVLEQLQQHGLLFEVERTWPTAYRTRMAEAMRLFAHLRQQFSNKPWQAAAPLVADFRFRHEPRRFPKRDLNLADVSTRLSVQGISPKFDAAAKILDGRDLSQFQLDSTVAILNAMAGRDRGVVVSAGTGSGKTLAFYLPALIYLGTRPDGETGAGVIAIYPRNELLKDQLASALDETRRLRSAGGRQIRIGAYFGNTPNQAQRGHAPNRQWRRAPAGWACPFLTCRVSIDDKRCGGDLIWQFADYETGREQLRCATCGDVVNENELILTRRKMQQQPPDLLFSTTETLNRSLSDGWSMHVFGVGPKARYTPRLVLLDEVHTYNGTNGAQVAYLLRRWRRLMRRSASRSTAWVGLSATLANAERFFAELCGLNDGAVEPVEPQPEHMEPRGREYQVVLRGDPGAQTALLSTTIQSLMLIRRVLDPRPTTIGAYGSRVFAFCDNLDLVNRLYRQVLDAEGFDEFGRRKANGYALADLRMSRSAQRLGAVVTDWPLRDADGQHWWMPEQLGFDGRVLTIGRTSSQDAGVNTLADVIVTTASLEVGFDDPQVGAVLQHKAPRDIASFLQRRGRAGRTQTQRPWTVVVLSDFGRDRAAYQDYETLLAPALPEKRLPLGNQSVRKMQAAMCLIDWAANVLNVSARRDSGRTMRKVFVKPDETHDPLREQTADLLDRVMSGGPERDDLIAFVGASMQLPRDEVEAVCWEQPRSLLLDAVPTARRRLASRWTKHRDDDGRDPDDSWVEDSPLPDFIPKALFSDLCLPEVAIEPPVGYDAAARESLAVFMALNELAPGKVTMRWAVERGKGLWIPPADDGGSVAVEEGIARVNQLIGEVKVKGQVLPLIRPLITAPVVPEPDVRPSSNGRLAWQIQHQPAGGAIEMTRPRSGPLRTCVTEVLAYLHTAAGALRTWRYATQTTASVLRRTGGRRELRNSFTWQGAPAAIGYEATVDAQIVTVTVPQTLAAFALGHSGKRLRQLRRDYFIHQMRSALHAVRIDAFLSRDIAEALAVAAAARIIGGGAAVDLTAIPVSEWKTVIGGLLHEGVIGLDDSDDEQHDSQAGSKQQERLLESLTTPHVAAAITAVIGELTAPPGDGWLPWLRDRYVQTIAAAWQAAAQQICPEFDADLDSLIDVDPLGDGPTATFIISDSAIGGGGLIDALTNRISEDPRRFDYLVTTALQASDLEEVDRSMRHTLDLLARNDGVARTAARFRQATGDRLGAWQDLLVTLTAEGVSPAHTTVTALASRIFRAASSPASDQLLTTCLRRWDETEERVGFAVDYRSICMTLLAEQDVRAALVEAIPEAAKQGDSWARSVLQGLLWPSAEARRAASLVASNRFVNEAPLTERTLVLDSLPNPVSDVDVDEPQWLRMLSDFIASSGRCRLYSASDDRLQLKHAIQQLVTSPIELGWLHVHAHVEAMARHDGVLHVEVSLEETPQ